MRVVFCLSGFEKDVLCLQPWLTVHQVARRFVAMGHIVDVVTDRSVKDDIEGITVYPVKSLRGYNSSEIIRLLESMRPDIVIIAVTPLSLISAKWYQAAGKYRAFAYISYPFYTVGETMKAFPYLTRTDRLSYGRQALIPDLLWASRLRAVFEGVICQSERTKTRLTKRAGGLVRVDVIPPGVESHWIETQPELLQDDKSCFVYIGSPSTIRGFSLVLKALKRVGNKGIRLKVLARGSDPATVESIEALTDAMGLRESVSVRGGWLERKMLQNEIANASAILMPFVLVPSELPVSIFEAICCETPIIVSDIDGLQEAVGECGIAVGQCSVSELAEAMDSIYSESGLGGRFREACRKRKNSIKTWEEVSEHWADTVGLQVRL